MNAREIVERMKRLKPKIVPPKKGHKAAKAKRLKRQEERE